MHRAMGVVGVVGRAVRGALPAITVASVIPLAILYAGLALHDVVGAIVASVVYAYGVAGYQWRRNRRVSGMLVMTLLLVTIRAIAAMATGDVFAYFVVPVAETAGFGLLFLASMFTSEPLIVRLARDFVPHLAEDLATRRSLIRWLSAVWTLTYLASGATTLVLLLTQSLGVYAAAHELAGWAWVAAGVATSIWLCRRKAQGLWQAALSPGTAPLAAAA